MSKLLTANFMRVKKDKFFWIGMIFMMAAGVIFPVNRYMDMKQTGFMNNIDNGFFGCALFIGILMAVFCSLFIGTEHSDGTMRNKIIVGRKRTEIYLSNCVTTAVVGVLLCAAFFLPYLCAGIPLLGLFDADVKLVLLLVLTVLLLAAAFASIFTLIAMLCQNKAVAVVICILLAQTFLFTGAVTNAMLDAPRTYPEYTIDENNNTVVSERPNTRYLDGAKREIVQIFYDINPGGQGIQCASLAAVHIERLPVYSLIIVILTTEAGVVFFKRRDLR